jgi:hypothetical protein
MIVTLAILLAASTPLLAAGLWRRRRVRLAIAALKPGRTVAYTTIALSRRHY